MQYDIVIIGGGMVGASLACALRDTALRIAIVDATPIVVHDDPRLIALNYSSYELFRRLGIWPELSSHAEAIKQVHISDRGHFGMTRLHAHEMGLDALGYVVPAKFINAALSTVMQSQPKQAEISLYRPAKLKHLTQADNHSSVVIETQTGEITLHAKYIIGADGTHSTVRELLGIETKTEDKKQSAIVTITELQRSHHHIAYERFHQSGAVAMLPLTGQRAATIWTDENKTIQQLLQLDDEEFLQTLQKQFGYRLGRLLKTGKRHHYPLLLVRAEQTLKHNAILIGNAAHTLHPIAAQGLNLALSEIEKLSQVIINQPEQPDWQQYLDWQTQQETTSLRLSHKLPDLYFKDFAPLNVARQLGMIGLDIIPSLKRRFIRHAIGTK